MQKQEHYTNLQRDLLRDLLTTCSFQMGWEITIEQYMNWRSRWIDNPAHQFGNS
jgi:hypothetical protein